MYEIIPIEVDGLTVYICKHTDKYLVDCYYDTGDDGYFWTPNKDRATRYQNENEAIEYCARCDIQAVSISAKLIDKMLSRLYNQHAFTNDELESIRETIIKYAVSVTLDSNVRKELENECASA